MQNATLSRPKHSVWKLLCCAVSGVLCAKAFSINPQLFIGKGATPAESTDYLWTFMALVLAALFYECFIRRGLRPRIGEVLFGLLFGVLNYFGTTLFAYDSWAFVGVTLSVPTVVLKCLGQGVTMMAVLTLLARLLTSAPSKPEAPRLPSVLGGLRRFYALHTASACLLLFFLCWLPYLLVYYPGTVISDMAWMFEQFEGIKPMTTWHSVFTTWVFGGCIRLGRLLSGDNLGCLLYMLLQTLALGWALARTVQLARRLGVCWKWQLAILAFYAVMPIWGVYCTMLGKDTLFTATLLLLLVETIEWSRGLRPFGARQWLGYGLLALLACLWRNNGLYIVAPSLLAFVLVLGRGRQRLWPGSILTAVLFAVYALNHLLVPALGIVDNTPSGIYSVCFQQTARTVRDHGGELTQDERAEIDRVLDLDTIAALYEPWISDPVKYTYRQFGQGADIEKEALERYRSTWFSMLKKYPLTYIQAFMAGNRGYYAFTPKYTGITYSQQAGMRFFFTSYWIEGEGQLHSEQPPALDGLRIKTAELVNRLRTVPIIQMLFTCPLYTWLLIAAGIALAHKRRYRELALFTPAAFCFATCLLSPVDDYFRYFLPIVAMSVPLLCCVRHPADAAHSR